MTSQEDVDYLWETLSKGGSKSRCGWLVDRFGLSWRIIPTRLTELLSHKDPKVVRRVSLVMLKMGKIEIAASRKPTAADATGTATPPPSNGTSRGGPVETEDRVRKLKSSCGNGMNA